MKIFQLSFLHFLKVQYVNINLNIEFSGFSEYVYSCGKNNQTKKYLNLYIIGKCKSINSKIFPRTWVNRILNTSC